MFKMVNKKAISPVITTVLLIMLSIAAVAIVAGFVIPWVQTSIDRGKCFDAIDNIYIDTGSEYTCYYMVTPTAGDPYAVLQVSVQRGAKALDIRSFYITAYGEGTSDKFEIVNNTAATPGSNIKMYGTTGNHLLKVPERREMRTYTIVTRLQTITSADLSPIIKGNIACDAASKETIEPCTP